jgi:hypothetical protein
MEEGTSREAGRRAGRQEEGESREAGGGREQGSRRRERAGRQEEGEQGGRRRESREELSQWKRVRGNGSHKERRQTQHYRCYRLTTL